MNLAQVVSSMLVLSVFTGSSLWLEYVIDEHNCDKLTEEDYLKSRIYEMTKTPYEQGITACKDFQKSLEYVVFALFPIGAGLAGFSFWFYRTKKIEGDKKIE